MSKRANLFNHGGSRDEDVYQERITGNEEDDVPQRATAAQLAARKMKTLPKSRRPAGAGSSAFRGLSVPLPPANPFGDISIANPSQPANPFTANTFNFSAPTPHTNMFGGNATTPTGSSFLAPSTEAAQPPVTQNDNPFAFTPNIPQQPQFNSSFSAFSGIGSTPAGSSLFAPSTTSAQPPITKNDNPFAFIPSLPQKSQPLPSTTSFGPFEGFSSFTSTGSFTQEAPATEAPKASPFAPKSSLFASQPSLFAPITSTSEPPRSFTPSFAQISTQATEPLVSQDSPFAAKVSPFASMASTEPPQPFIPKTAQDSTPTTSIFAPKDSLFAPKTSTSEPLQAFSPKTASIFAPKDSLFVSKASTSEPTQAFTPKTSSIFAPNDSLFAPKMSTSESPQTFTPKTASIFAPKDSVFGSKVSTSESPQAFLPKTAQTPTSQTAPIFAPQDSLFAPKTSTSEPPQQFTTKAAQNSTPQTIKPLTSEVAQIPTSEAPQLAASATTQQTDIPKIPKVFPPPSSKMPSFTLANVPVTIDELGTQIAQAAIELHTLNQKFKDKINNCPVEGDWTPLSLWHNKESTELIKKITTLKKQRAATKGITGDESSLSTKRKMVQDSSPDLNATPSKKAREDALPNTPTSGSSNSPISPPFGLSATWTPALKPESSTSNLFANSIGKNNSSTSSTVAPSFGSPSKMSGPESPAKPIEQLSIPKFGTSTNSGVPSFGVSIGSGIPKFGNLAGGAGFSSAFAQNVETAEALAAKRKQKAKDEDWDSDEETEEQWSARYDREEAERKAKEKANKTTFTPSLSVSAASSISNGETPGAKPVFDFQKPISGTSTPGLLNSRVSSPGPSVFDSPQLADTPSSNIFGHLSEGPSSNDQDESGEEGGGETEEEDGATPKGSSSLKHPHDGSGSGSDADSDESEVTLEQHMNHGKPKGSDGIPAVKKSSLFDRITKDPEPEPVSDTENTNLETDKGLASNGVATPAGNGKRYATFDFASAAAKTAPPKSTTFAGDQTFKHDSPIKFSVPGSETKATAPTFNFQPASAAPSPAAASKSFSSLFAPVGSSGSKPSTSLFASSAGVSGTTTPGTFSFLNPNASQSGANSGVSSVFSSRAATPLSEQETSAQESGGEEGTAEHSNQLDLSGLTADEKKDNEILFTTDSAIAKKQIVKDGNKTWDMVAKAPLFLLKDKESGKVILRLRLPGGSTPINFYAIPKIRSTLTGNKSKKMVIVPYPVADSKPSSYLFMLRTEELAAEFSKAFDTNVV